MLEGVSELFLVGPVELGNGSVKELLLQEDEVENDLRPSLAQPSRQEIPGCLRMSEGEDAPQQLPSGLNVMLGGRCSGSSVPSLPLSGLDCLGLLVVLLQA